MILEHAVLNVKPGRSVEFERAFRQAEPIISGSGGYLSHQLLHCIDQPDRFLLLVHWETLEDHVDGFRNSEQYQVWRRLLHDFYDPFPEVDHYEITGPS
ncbi:MAG: antibiotic biosynthesis monooxygenase [Dehalococcoidia bacterium]|nr:antibiotic biosynthesis monooxygenase [Dehalococcoidia bacterium]